MGIKQARLVLTALGAALVLSLPARGAEKADAPFPSWVFGHVVWMDESTTQSVYELAKGYMAHGIPVDGVIIDSPWETAYNTFEFDPERYPEAQKLIDDLHHNDIKVIMWITSMVNFQDPAYQMCLDKGYFVKGREEVTWWKGAGGMIDYENPEALEWWHERMNRTIDMGIDGWKCDGTDPFMLLKKPVNLVKNWKLRKEYSNDYYSDFYHYTRERSGEKTVIMARPMEQLLNESVFGLPTWTNPLGAGVYLKYAPVEISFMSWVGDQDPTFDGLKIATRWVLDSAKNDYLVVGSDIGGYRGGGPDKEVLVRWTQFGSLCPFMENGGVGEHRPWHFDGEAMRVYRAYALLHKVLLPYLYSQAVEAWNQGRSMVRPLSRGRDHYMLGRDMLVAPIQQPCGKKRVVLPKGSDWWPLFAGGEYLAKAEKCRVKDSELPLLKGGCSFTYTYGLHEYPVFARAGALIPIKPGAGPGLFNDPGIKEEPGAMMLVPPAPGKEFNTNEKVYMEGRGPLSFTGEMRASGHTVSCEGGDWPVFIPESGWPRVPESVEPIDWKD